MPKLFFAFCALVVYLFCSACTSNRGNWGATSTFSPGWKQLKASTETAIKDPHTWAPLVGAAVFSIGDLDYETVKWASEHNPVFGSQKAAKKASDDMRDFAGANYFVTALATPSGSGMQGLKNKTRGMVFGALALRTNHYASRAIKSYSNRQRPLGKSSYDSFPSLHTSSTSISGTLANRNIDVLSISNNRKKIWQWSNHTIAGLVGWARIEAGVHYPTDVLTGYALGNFLGAFLNDAFIAPQDRDDYRVNLFVAPNGEYHLTLGMQF